MEKVNTESVIGDTAEKHGREGEVEIQQKGDTVLNENGQKEKDNDTMVPIMSVDKGNNRSGTEPTNKEKELQVKEEYLKEFRKRITTERRGVKNKNTNRIYPYKIYRRSL